MNTVTVTKSEVHYMQTEEGYFMRDSGGQWWADYPTSRELVGYEEEELEALFQANKPE